MLQFDGGQAQTADPFPNWPLGGGATSHPLTVPGPPVLGPTMMGVGVLLSIYNNLTDVQLAYRDTTAGGAIGWKQSQIIEGMTPGQFVFPKALGFRARSHNPGQVAQIVGQVWEIDDGPMPVTPLSTNAGNLSPSGVITPVIGPGIVNVQHNDTLVGSEPSLDFLDTSTVLWAVVDDGPNTRVRMAATAVSPPPSSSGVTGDLVWSVATSRPNSVLCDGSHYNSVADPTFAALFAMIGTYYGGGGSFDFAVPDVEGRLLVMKGTNADVGTLGENDGLPLATRSPLHNHTNTFNGVSPALNVRPGDNGATGGRVNGVGDAAVSGGQLFIGPGGTRPTDSPAFMVQNLFILK